METYKDCLVLTKEDFDENGLYNGPFEVSNLVNCDVEIDKGLGAITFRKPDDKPTDLGALCTTGYVLVGKGTDLNVHGHFYAKTLITKGSIYCTQDMGVGTLRVNGNVICEANVQVVKSFYVGGRIVTPRLRLSSLEIQMPQRYYAEQSKPNKKG